VSRGPVALHACPSPAVRESVYSGAWGSVEATRMLCSAMFFTRLSPTPWASWAYLCVIFSRALGDLSIHRCIPRVDRPRRQLKLERLGKASKTGCGFIARGRWLRIHGACSRAHPTRLAACPAFPSRPRARRDWHALRLLTLPLRARRLRTLPLRARRDWHARWLSSLVDSTSAAALLPSTLAVALLCDNTPGGRKGRGRVRAGV